MRLRVPLVPKRGAQAMVGEVLAAFTFPPGTLIHRYDRDWIDGREIVVAVVEIPQRSGGRIREPH